MFSANSYQERCIFPTMTKQSLSSRNFRNKLKPIKWKLDKKCHKNVTSCCQSYYWQISKFLFQVFSQQNLNQFIRIPKYAQYSYCLLHDKRCKLFTTYKIGKIDHVRQKLSKIGFPPKKYFNIYIYSISICTADNAAQIRKFSSIVDLGKYVISAMCFHCVTQYVWEET